MKTRIGHFLKKLGEKLSPSQNCMPAPIVIIRGSRGNSLPYYLAEEIVGQASLEGVCAEIWPHGTWDDVDLYREQYEGPFVVIYIDDFEWNDFHRFRNCIPIGWTRTSVHGSDKEILYRHSESLQAPRCEHAKLIAKQAVLASKKLAYRYSGRHKSNDLPIPV